MDKRGPLNSIVALTHAKGGAVEHPEFVVFKELHKNWFVWEQQFKRNAETRLWLDEATGATFQHSCSATHSRCQQGEEDAGTANTFSNVLLQPVSTTYASSAVYQHFFSLSRGP